MIIDAHDYREKSKLKSQVCIVGAGVAGITLALELKGIFSDIVILESGSEYFNADTQSLYRGTKRPEFYPDPTTSRFRILGGSCNFWSNNTSPLDPIDFEYRSWIPNSGWPISYSDIEPYYKKAELYCGTGGEGYDLDFWLDKTRSEDLVSRSSILETSIAKAAVPPTLFFRTNSLELQESKSIRVIKNANLRNLDIDEVDEKVENVEFSSDRNMDLIHNLSADVFIFCMGGIENARMLLFFNRKLQDKLGNKSKNVGHYFMDHPVPRAAIFFPKKNDRTNFQLYKRFFFQPEKTVVGFFKLQREILIENETINLRMPLHEKSEFELSDGVNSFHILKDSLSDGELHDKFGFHISNILNDIDMVTEAASRKLFNYSIFDYSDDFYGYILPVMMEQTPDYKNRITLSDETDRYGIPRININWEITQENKDMVWESLKLTAKGLGGESLGRMRLLNDFSERVWGSQLGFGHHHMGTTRMSDNDKNGVVDSNLKLFGSKNLYILGSSVFPTGGHVPPTLTIVALSVRLAEHLTKIHQN